MKDALDPLGVTKITAEFVPDGLCLVIFNAWCCGIDRGIHLSSIPDGLDPLLVFPSQCLVFPLLSQNGFAPFS